MKFVGFTVLLAQEETGLSFFVHPLSVCN